MDPDGSPPFKAAASNPMLGYEAEEWQLPREDTTGAMLETLPISQIAYDAQDFSQGSTIDPSLLLSHTGTTETPPGVGEMSAEMDFVMGMDINVGPSPYQVQCSQKET